MKNKLIRNYTMTSALVHDSQKSSELLDESNSNRDVYSDSAYYSESFVEERKKRNFRKRLNCKAQI